jgi:hypothetical protein
MLLACTFVLGLILLSSLRGTLMPLGMLDGPHNPWYVNAAENVKNYLFWAGLLTVFVMALRRSSL